jgi:hypothetical protein
LRPEVNRVAMVEEKDEAIKINFRFGTKAKKQ